jgi:hypothetical protein
VRRPRSFPGIKRTNALRSKQFLITRLAIRGLKARMRDGTLVSIPEDGALPHIDDKKLKTGL